MSDKCNLFLPFLAFLGLLSSQQSLFVLPDLCELVSDDIIDSLHELACLVLVGLSVPQRHLIQRHDFQGEIGDGFEQILAEREGEFALGCTLHLHHLISFADLVLEDVDDTLVLLVDALDVPLGLPAHCLLVAFLVGETG